MVLEMKSKYLIIQIDIGMHSVGNESTINPIRDIFIPSAKTP